MAAYKTPGVYVEEIVKFPPSVAQVETAIPAFIGYTEKATNKIVGDLNGVPTRITSLLEYETYFGFAKAETSIDVTINDIDVDGETVQSIVVDQPSSKQPFTMYYAMQMYFANGGGPCYIMSIGRFGDARSDGDDQVTDITEVDVEHYNDGLAEVRKVDEVTLLVFPDLNAYTDDTTYYGVYNSALTQCKELQDRFTIIDPRTYDASSPTDANIGILREKINLEKDYLKYGAAYYPFIKTVLNFQYDESKIVLKHKASGSNTVVSGLISDVNDQIAIIETNRDAIATQITALDDLPSANDLQLDDEQPDYPDNVRDAADVAIEAINTALDNITAANTVIETKTQAAADTIVTAEDNDLKSELEGLITDNPGGLKPFFASGAIKNVTLYTGDTKGTNADFDIEVGDYADAEAYGDGIDAKISGFLTYINTANKLLDVGGQLDEYITFLKDAGASALLAKLAEANAADDGGAYDDKTLADLQTLNNALYNQIKVEIANLPMELPPSSSIAGVYARVDSDRGVWKAPANVGLTYVIEPSLQVSHDDQKDLNVDTQAGKSINAIRSFTGKGVLVWGARTLAGNDNEWRYISVRRFFNMAEESIKKATEQFVFEPNDKNTWVRVKAMINNFLTAQWRAGALAGPTPEKAFYVNIGLGETMTAIDILEGNMIVEIGMAVVRPAEFIILRFSHKMQEA